LQGIIINYLYTYIQANKNPRSGVAVWISDFDIRHPFIGNQFIITLGKIPSFNS